MVSGLASARTAWASVKVAGTRVIHLVPVSPSFSSVLFAVERTIGDHIGRAIGDVQLREIVTDHLTKVGLITAITTERFHQDGNARLMFDHEIEHHLVEVRAMITARAMGI